MPPLPVLSGKEARRIFEAFGWEYLRQTGSHMVFKKSDIDFNLLIPNHRELDRGLLRGLIRDADLSVETFIAKRREL